jgi:integrase
MATIRQRASGNWEVIIRSKQLPRGAYYATLDTEDQAREYAAKIEARIKAGDIPKQLLAAPLATLGELLERYRQGACLSAHDLTLLDRLGVEGVRADELTVQWALSWVSSMHSTGIAPSTIRHKVGCLARCLDWCKLAGLIEVNPVRELPRNYAAYPVSHSKARLDHERDRRLLEGEELRIREVLKDRHDWLLLFDMALETAMRLREMFTLDWSQIDYEQRTIFLSKTKNGDKRQVPMSSVIHQRLKERGIDEGLVFPWWDGSIDTLAKTTARLSHQWSRIARDAGCVDLRFHDLRRHAITRLYLETKLSDMEISLISGHKSMKMLRRYSNLRGSDLAKKMW